jgi:hypothetical protein
MEEMLAVGFLSIAADTLDDIERSRIAIENRIRALTRDEPDRDGLTRGWALTEDHPDVARLVAMLAPVQDAERQAELWLKRVFRKHPLAPWAKAQKGIGEKQGARLVAAIGDPYIRPEITYPDGTVEPARPRRGPDELKAYCGMDVRDGQAAARRKGQRVNWNPTARMRTYLVSESCMKQDGRYREIYDIEREYLADATHARACVRCGPAGHPALPGSPLSDAHKHARALRKISQAILVDLWVESKRLYEVNGWPTEDEDAA